MISWPSYSKRKTLPSFPTWSPPTSSMLMLWCRWSTHVPATSSTRWIIFILFRNFHFPFLFNNWHIFILYIFLRFQSRLVMTYHSLARHFQTLPSSKKYACDPDSTRVNFLQFIFSLFRPLLCLSGPVSDQPSPLRALNSMNSFLPSSLMLSMPATKLRNSPN